MSSFNRSTRFNTTSHGRKKDLIGHQSFIGHNGQSRQPRSARTGSKGEGKISNDYIKVLQDQVYFLELENNLLKNGDGQQLNKTSTHNHAHYNTHGVVDGGPLEEQFQSLRAKYEALQAGGNDEFNSLKAKAEEWERQNDDMRRELAYVTQDRDLLAQQLEAVQNDAEGKQSSLLEINLSQEESVKRLEERVNQMSREYDGIVEQLAQTKEESSHKFSKLRKETYKGIERGKKAENKSKMLDEKLRISEAENLELREEIKRGHEKEQKQIYDLRNDNLALRQDNKRSKLKLEQAIAAERKANDIFEGLMQENNQVKETVEHLENELAAMRRKELNREHDGKSWSQQVVNLKRKIVMLQAEMEDYPNKLGEKEDKIKELRMFVRKTEELSIRLDTQQEREKRFTVAADEQSVIIQQLKRDRIIFQGQYEDIIAKHTELQETYEVTRKAKDQLSFNLKKLSARASIADSIEALNLGNFMQMQESNMKVANAVKDLVHKLGEEEGDLARTRVSTQQEFESTRRTHPNERKYQQQQTR